MGARSSQSRGPGLNKTDGHLLEYFRNTFSPGGGGTNVTPPESGLKATGGVISDYTSGSDVYRAHIFTSSSTFEVTELGNLGDNLEYLVVAGGGGGADDDGGGGGAGGFRTNLTGHPVKAADYTAAVGTYTVTVGAGGVGGTNPDVGAKGNNSEFYPTPVSYPSTQRIRSVGGGCGFKNPMPADAPGGSGGGSGWNADETTYGAGNTPTDPNHPQVQGYRGGGNHPSINAGGGGGAGGVGQPGNDSSGYSKGGVGLQCLIAGPTSAAQPIGAEGPGGHSAGWFAGGGGGGGRTAQSRYGGGGTSSPFSGGGTGGGPSRTVTSGTQNTGGGGGGFGPSGNGTAGNGGSGVVVVRYKIASIATEKASGGVISFAGGKTIHTFTSSGIFHNPEALTVDYLLVGGGGGGGGNNGGGGGGGGVVSATGQPLPASPRPVSIGSGGNFGYQNSNATNGTATTWNSLTAGGGGSGGRYPSTNGGAGSNNSSGGGSGQGTSGGSGNGTGGNGYTNPSAGGGGGGAGGNATDKNGADGATNSILGTSYYWAGGGGGATGPGGGNGGQGGGGGGGCENGYTAGTAGTGGLGTGDAGTVSPGSDSGNNQGGVGAENTGGGGGGGGAVGNGDPLARGANGGSGIVIISYPT